MIPAIQTAVILLIGAGLTWFIYGEHLVAYHREGDAHAADMTMLAMLGTFLPTLAAASLPWAS